MTSLLTDPPPEWRFQTVDELLGLRNDRYVPRKALPFWRLSGLQGLPDDACHRCEQREPTARWIEDVVLGEVTYRLCEQCHLEVEDSARGIALAVSWFEKREKEKV